MSELNPLLPEAKPSKKNYLGTIIPVVKLASVGDQFVAGCCVWSLDSTCMLLLYFRRIYLCCIKQEVNWLNLTPHPLHSDHSGHRPSTDEYGAIVSSLASFLGLPFQSSLESERSVSWEVAGCSRKSDTGLSPRRPRFQSFVTKSHHIM